MRSKCLRPRLGKDHREGKAKLQISAKPVLRSMKEPSTLVPVVTILLYSKNDAMRSLRLMTHAMVEVRIQFKRVKEEIGILNELHLKGLEVNKDGNSRGRLYSDKMSELFTDFHFLLVALKRLKLSFENGVMKSCVKDEPEIVEVRKKHIDLLRRINHFRNCLEHIEEEAATGKPDLGQINLRSQIFIFKGGRFYFGPKLEVAMEDFHKEVDAAVIGILNRKKIPEEDRLAVGIIKVP